MFDLENKRPRQLPWRFRNHLGTCCVRAAMSFLIISFFHVDAFAEEAAANWRTSCYVYRDINRNGKYDMGDVFYADLLIEMERPDGLVVKRRSNIDGFANFEMRLDDFANSVIVEPGTYKVRAILPRDWTTLSPETLKQDLTFYSNVNAGGGTVPKQPCAHIGVAPQLLVFGSIALENGVQASNLVVTARTGSEQLVSVQVDELGHYKFQAKPGNWEIQVTERASGKSTKRDIVVDQYNVIVSSISVNTTYPPRSTDGLISIDFDDLTTSDALFEIPSGYGGLDWKYWISTHKRFYQGGGYINAVISGEYVAYNSSGVPGTISRDKPFDLEGVYVTAAWPRGEADGVTVKAWRQDELKYNDKFRISNAGASYFQANYSQVDRIEFSHGVYERIVLDRLTYRD